MEQLFFTTVSANSEEDLQEELREIEKTYHARNQTGTNLTYEVVPNPSEVKFTDLRPQVFNVTAFTEGDEG
ncbi:hypothetical protein [Brevibacillus sp. SYSU BS000544]|uniref:hypothetical protein n=1 Tax=Brevibacillus sp. SYSU BS000544 TaxID=3416443 RepID=UPI003CE54970